MDNEDLYGLFTDPGLDMVWQSYAAAVTCLPDQCTPQGPENITMPSSLMSAGAGEQHDVAALLNDIATTPDDVAAHSAAALTQVCRSIITGEGPCVAGRKHFSRTLDADDADLCARILVLAGRHGDAVSRQEANVLFEIAAAGGERCDGGRFDDLLVKAVLHHLLAACGRAVPDRATALSPEVPVERWASPINPGPTLKSWLAGHLRELRSSKAAETIARVMSGSKTAGHDESIAGVFDIAA